MSPGDEVWVKISVSRRVVGGLVEEVPEKHGWLVNVGGQIGGFAYSEISPVEVQDV